MLEDKNIAIGLSGGGLRALVFHAGVFKYLADQNCIERIIHVSTVSGGSMFLGLILSLNQNRWPSSEEYKTIIWPKLKNILTTKRLSRSLYFNIFLSFILYFFGNKSITERPLIFAESLKKQWGIDSLIKNLDMKETIWTINTTCMETGKRFRFKISNNESNMGDYITLYADSSDVETSFAIAASCAFPIFLGPSSLSTKNRLWSSKYKGQKEPLSEKYHLWDGGVYDNQGIEALFDVGTGAFRDKKANYLIISDAGEAEAVFRVPHWMWAHIRMLKLFAIFMEQIKLIKKRVIRHDLLKKQMGAYINLGFWDDVEVSNMKGKNDFFSIERSVFFTKKDAQLAQSYDTKNLGRFTIKNFDLISDYGYHAADWFINHATYEVGD